jgi:hypothetical protein
MLHQSSEEPPHRRQRRSIRATLKALKCMAGLLVSLTAEALVGESKARQKSILEGGLLLNLAQVGWALFMLPMAMIFAYLLESLTLT